MRKSKECYKTLSITLAGLPILTHLTFLPRDSTILSTAIFEGAHAKTFYPFLTAFTIN
jgi:hypothetical protein